MAAHDMGPSTVAGFSKQCRNCGALDTEIMFALGQECPNAPKVQPEAVEQRITHEQLPQPTYAQRVIMMQAEWMHNHFVRQFRKAGQ